MHRWVVLLLALLGCDTPAEQDLAQPQWVYPPAVAPWPVGEVTGTIGRSQAPQPSERLGISGAFTVPLRLPTPWGVPGDGPARAAVYGLAGAAPAVELIDIDAGKILWRDTTECAGPIVGVTEDVIVCADGKGTRAIGLDGKSKWKTADAFIAMSEDRVVTAGAGESIVLDAQLGDELARITLPAPATPRGKPALPPVASDSIVASCGDAGRELFAHGQDARLVRIAEAAGGPKITWAVPLPAVAAIDACEGATVLVTTTSDAGTTLVSLARDTGKVTGSISGVRGFWRARDGSARIEVSTSAGIAIYSRDLTGVPEATALPVLAELLAERGELRLVRATKYTSALLDAKGVRAYVPLAQLGAALGDKSFITASWTGSPGESVHRYAFPPRYAKQLRVPPERDGLAVPAELRDLPAPSALDSQRAHPKPDTAKYGVAAVALDPVEPAVYAATLERAPDDATPTGIARFNLHKLGWIWARVDGCGMGTPVALVAARDFVACAARTSKSGSVIATTRDGSPLWQWHGDNVDTIQAAGDVVLVHDADRLHVLDGRDGALLASYRSDDGAAFRATVLDVDGMTMVITFQRGRVIARLPRVEMVPAWTLAIGGVVDQLAPAADGVLVALEDGDAYRVDARTGATVAVPGLHLAWLGSGDVIAGHAPGGPVPPAKPAAPLAPKRPFGRRLPPPPPRDPAEDPPRLPKPWPTPVGMATSWQLTLYEVTGALRTRNDYALDAAITPAPRGPDDSPLVVAFGPGARELLVIDPRRGDPLKRVQLPDSAAPGTAFATVVDGKPVVGTMLVNPLSVGLF